MVLASEEKSEEKRRKKAKVKLPFGGRKTTIIIFGTTVFLSLFFWLKTELSVFWQKFRAPVVVMGGAKESQFDPAPVLAEFKTLTQNLRGAYGVYVYRFADGREYGQLGTETFPAASLMKLPVMLAVYQIAEAGQISLEDIYQLAPQDKAPGAGFLYNQPVGTSYSYRQLVEYMGQSSDNTAYRALLRLLGRQEIQAVIAEAGLQKTILTENQTSPQDIGLLWRIFYRGDLVSRASGKEILSFLTDTDFENRIPAGVPEGVRVAHKIGTEIGNYADAGIVFAEPPFVLVIISKNAREAEALDVLPKIARAVWEFENHD